MDKLDWRKSGDYEFTRNLSLDEWAWEFLRRCPEYRQEWESLRRSHTAFCGMILKDCREKWGLRRGYLDPGISWVNVEFTPPGGRTISPYLFDRGEGVRLVTGKTKICYEFDVQQPISPQLKAVKKRLKTCQIKCPTKTRKSFKPNYPHDEWPRMLRLLDAVAEGASASEIMTILYSCEVRILDKRKQALRMACEDYRHIPFSK